MQSRTSSTFVPEVAFPSMTVLVSPAGTPVWLILKIILGQADCRQELGAWESSLAEGEQEPLCR